ncbi:MAG: sulfotransferase [Bacteroidia bacterium]|nr:sulfotransferase [Bacteroidia bacterium]
METKMNKEEITDLPFFFIHGPPRSGTTLLASLFDAHPSVMLPFECPLIINIYSRYYKTINWDKKTIIRFCRDIKKQRKFDSWDVDHDQLLNYLLTSEGKADFETMIKAVYLNFNSLFRKENIKIIGDKNLVYNIYPDRLAGLFPEAKFIHLTRDYRDNILSIQKMDFEAPFASLLAYRWRYAAKQAEKLKKKIPSSFFTIKYEDLVQDPSYHLGKMCEFLGITYDPSVLDFHNIKDELFRKFPREHIERYHSSLLNPVDATKIYGWKKSMPEKEVMISDAAVGKWAEMEGYERKYKTIKPKLYFYMIIGILYGWLAYQLRFTVDLLPFRLKSYIRNKGPLVAVLYNRIILKK